MAGYIGGKAVNLSTSGADISGTANLDVVDVDGAANFAADVTFADGADIITASAGTSNFRAGVNAGNSIQSGGNFNTVVGNEAGTAITTGDNNTAVGYTAGYSNTTGGQNTFVGRQAAYSNTTGESNASFGNGCLYENSTGSFNTALGSNALQENTTASNNVAVGYQAGYTQTTSGDSTYLGYQAGYSRTGSGNTCIGNYSGRDGTTGTDNTLVGRNSGYTITSGSKNTIIGMYNGNQHSLDIRTSSNNIVLSNGDGNPRVVVDSSGNVMVGKTSTGIGTVGAELKPTGELLVTVNNDSCAFLNRKGSDGSIVDLRNDGTTVGSISVSGSSTAYNTSSDHRLKENVVYDWDATTRLKQLKPARFNFIADADTTVDGFLAHEAATVVPEAVTGTKDEVDADGNAVMQGIDQSKIVPLLVKTIQELEARITALEGA